MDNYRIELRAILEANAAGNLQKEIDKIEGLKVKIDKAELSPEAINHIKQQLTQNGVDLSLIFGDTSRVASQATRVGQQIGQQISQGVSSGMKNSTHLARASDTAAIKESQKTYRDLLATAQQLSALKTRQLQITPESNPEQWKALSIQIDDVSSKYNKLWSDFFSNPKTLEIFKMEDLNRIREVGFALDETRAKIQDVQNSTIKKIDLMANGGIKNDYATQIANLQGSFRKLGLSEDEVAGKTSKISEALTILQSELAKPLGERSFEAIEAANNAVQKELAETSNEYTKLRAVAKANAIRMDIGNGKYDADFATIKREFESMGLSSEEVEAKLKGLKLALDNLKAGSGGAGVIDLDASFSAELEKAKNSARVLKSDLNQIYNPKKQSNLSIGIQNWLSKNTAASQEAKQKLQEYLTLLGNGSVNVATLDKIQREWKEIDALERKEGRLGKGWLGSIATEMKSFARWSISSALIMKPIQAFRDAISVMKEVDSELVNIQKVTNATAEEMKNLTKEAYNMATAYGRSPTEFLKSVTAFSRAGYGDMASTLGELSLLAQNVGDVEAELADSFLLSADAAWKYGGNIDDLRRILDGFNELSNRTATDVKNLAEGITVAGSVFAQAGLTAQDYAGIVGTATAKTQRSGNEMARAWRTILMRIRQIRGTDTETGEVIDSESLSKAEKTLKSIGIEIREVVNGQNELRNPMDILTELAGKWKDLSSVQQAALQEALAGRLLPERIEMCA